MKAVKSLLTGLLVVSAALHAETKTNRTWINVRGPVDGVAGKVLFTGTPEKKSGPEVSDDNIGGRLSVVGEYAQNRQRDKLGARLAPFGNYDFTVKFESATRGTNLDAKNFIPGTGLTSDATIKLEPKHTRYGAGFSYAQSLDGVVDGMWFAAATGAYHVENDAGVTHAGGTTTATYSTMTTFLDGTGFTPSTALYYKTTALTKGLIDGQAHSKTRIADVDLKLGWDFLKKDKATFGGYLFGTVPTADDRALTYAFEPVVGGRHFGFGAGLCATANVWEDGDSSFKANFDVNYRYFFEREESRIAQVKETYNILCHDGEDEAQTDSSELTYGWGHYFMISAASRSSLIAETGDDTYPAANVLGQVMKVKPRGRILGDVSVCYEYSNFTVALGYHLYWQQEESNTLKNWSDTAYALQPSIYKLHTTAATTRCGTTALKGTDLSINEPSQASHSIYTTIGYMSHGDIPFGVMAGGYYELAGDREKTPEMWGFTAKFSIDF